MIQWRNRITQAGLHFINKSNVTNALKLFGVVRGVSCFRAIWAAFSVLLALIPHPYQCEVLFVMSNGYAN